MNDYIVFWCEGWTEPCQFVAKDRAFLVDKHQAECAVRIGTCTAAEFEAMFVAS